MRSVRRPAQAITSRLVRSSFKYLFFVFFVIILLTFFFFLFLANDVVALGGAKSHHYDIARGMVLVANVVGSAQSSASSSQSLSQSSIIPPMFGMATRQFVVRCAVIK